MSSTEAFNALLIGHMPRLRAYAMQLTRDGSSADDLLQETAFHALRARNQFQMGTNFTAWMFRILRNEFFSSLRRAKRKMVPMDILPESLFVKQASQEDFVFGREIVRAVEKLKPDQRQVLELVCAGGLSYGEAAEAIDCSIGTVKSRLWRTRQHVESLLRTGENVAHAS